MSSSSQGAESWISAFCNHIGHEYFAEVSEDFIEDDFNLTGLQSQVPMYKEALEMILDVEPDDEGSLDDELEEEEEHTGSSDASMRDYRRTVAERRAMRMSEDASVIESSADLLYGLIHQRYITSRPGMQQMQEKYDMGHFGTCPRVYCRGARVLPVGCSDIPGQETVKLFCPACLDVYAPPNSRFQNVDGAFFGTTFGCLFFMTFPDYDVGGTRPLDNLESSQRQQQQQQQQQQQGHRQSTTTSAVATGPLPASNATKPSQPPATINGVQVSNLAPGLSETALYQPRIYGFKVSALAKTGPRMQWLRRKPADIHELDEVEYMKRMSAAMAAVDGSSGAAQVEGHDDEEDEEEGQGEEQDRHEDELEAEAEQRHAHVKAGKTETTSAPTVDPTLASHETHAETLDGIETGGPLHDDNHDDDGAQAAVMEEQDEEEDEEADEVAMGDEPEPAPEPKAGTGTAAHAQESRHGHGDRGTRGSTREGATGVEGGSSARQTRSRSNGNGGAAVR